MDNPFDPAELPEVAAADKACRTAMRFMRKLDGPGQLRSWGREPTRRRRHQKCRDGGPRGLRRGRPLDAARAAVTRRGRPTALRKAAAASLGAQVRGPRA